MDTTVTRSYDDRYRCLTCTGPRRLHNILETGRDLFFSVTDQHFPATVLPQDGNCFVTVRMSNMNMIDLGTHTVWQIANERSKTPSRSAVSADAHGALTLIPYLKRPNSTLSKVEGNIPKYEIEMANVARQQQCKGQQARNIPLLNRDSWN
jgi:hypothetical protein